MLTNMEKFGFFSQINKPIESTYVYKENFLDKLKLLQKCIDEFNTFDIYLYELQEQLANRTIPNIYYDAYCGYSYCRICDKQDNGNKDIILVGKDKTICIPNGYLHYIFEHNINVPEDFENYIISFDFESAISAISSIKLYYKTNGDFVRRYANIKNIKAILNGNVGIFFSN